MVWKRFEEMKERLGIIGDIRGKGLLIGVEFVRDLKTKQQFPDSMAFGVQVGKAAIKNGLIIRADPHWIAVAPPLVIEPDEIEIMMDRLSASIEEVLVRVGR
jgi:adenosylmethionine-8-amino-7-oxononanoate aminotransferase